MKAAGKAPLLGLGLACAAYLALLLWTDTRFRLLDADELTHARAALEASRDGHWFPLSVGAQPWAEKPPLLPWMTAALFKVFGPTELAARFWPSTFAALALGLAVLLALEMGATVFSAACVGLGLAFSRDWLYHARFLSMDMPVLALGLGAILLHRRQRWLGAGLCLAGIAAFKSWFALAWALPFVLDRFWGARAGRVADLSRLLLPPLAALALWLQGSALAYGPGFWHQALVHETLDRFSGQGHPASAPPLRFYLAWARAFFPLGLFAGAFCAGAFLRRSSEQAQSPERWAWLFLACWGLGLLLVKVTVFHYFLPWGTVAAILAAVLLSQAGARGLFLAFAGAACMARVGPDLALPHAWLLLGIVPAALAAWPAPLSESRAQIAAALLWLCFLSGAWDYALHPPDHNGALIQALRDRDPKGAVAVLGRPSQAPAFYGPWDTRFFGPEAPPAAPYLDAASGHWVEK